MYCLAVVRVPVEGVMGCVEAVRMWMSQANRTLEHLETGWKAVLSFLSVKHQKERCRRLGSPQELCLF